MTRNADTDDPGLGSPAPDKTLPRVREVPPPPAPATSCPVCGEALEGRPVLLCTACGTPHHADCWNYGRGCAVFACGERTARPPAPLPMAARDDTVLPSWYERSDDGTTVIRAIPHDVMGLGCMGAAVCFMLTVVAVGEGSFLFPLPLLGLLAAFAWAVGVERWLRVELRVGLDGSVERTLSLAGLLLRREPRWLDASDVVELVASEPADDHQLCTVSARLVNGSTRVLFVRRTSSAADLRRGLDHLALALDRTVTLSLP